MGLIVMSKELVIVDIGDELLEKCIILDLVMDVGDGSIPRLSDVGEAGVRAAIGLLGDGDGLLTRNEFPTFYGILGLVRTTTLVELMDAVSDGS